MEITPPWDGRHATYATLRDFVGAGPDGRPAFLAAGMLTAGAPAPGWLWDDVAWREVPLGHSLVREGSRVLVVTPEDREQLTT